VTVVFDSGVWISAISRRGVPWTAITQGLENDIFLTCIELESEVVRIVEKKFGVRPEGTQQRLAELLERSVRVAFGRKDFRHLSRSEGRLHPRMCGNWER